VRARSLGHGPADQCNDLGAQRHGIDTGAPEALAGSGAKAERQEIFSEGTGADEHEFVVLAVHRIKIGKTVQQEGARSVLPAQVAHETAEEGAHPGLRGT